MEGCEGSPPHSLCMIRAAELFPKPTMETEDKQLAVPFQELAGESVKYLGRISDGVLALSNYRLFMLKKSTNSETSVPLGLIESAQARDLFNIIINCKDASTVTCSFKTAEQCAEWQRRLQLSVGVPETLESLFAFPFYSWTCDLSTGSQNSSFGCGNSIVDGDGGIENPNCSLGSVPDYSERLQRAQRYDDDFRREVERLGFDLNSSWRISNANEEFKLCPSYPQKLLVPCCITDETLHVIANFRGSRRLPVVVWRHPKSCAVIARCSQPEVGWLGWRNSKDEQLLKALADACAFDRGEQMRQLALSSSVSTNGAEQNSAADTTHEEVVLDEVKKILIVDARSYASAVTNRARGGGCECTEYYPCADIEFMNLGNIHVIRKSFHALRNLCASPPDNPSWLGLLEQTKWLQHLSGLLAASMTVCHAIENKEQAVVVHCSDGWDRTPQIVATAELCLDPFYRTVEGFRILVEREWLNYGHKFADRCGHGPGSDEVNERCPVFLQWLDLVHQIHKQFPCSFEFSMAYLIKLAQHSLSCLFGTFLCNTVKERLDNSILDRTFSVWPFLSGPMYKNPLYIANRERVLWPAHNVRDLYLWSEIYLGSLGNQNSIDFPTTTTSATDNIPGSTSPMSKTRSYGDLIGAGVLQSGISRRSSDPNMTVDPNLTIGFDSGVNSNIDIQSEREDSPDIINNLIHDTTRKLQNLTSELNNHDENNFQDYKKYDIFNIYAAGNSMEVQNEDIKEEELLKYYQEQQSSKPISADARNNKFDVQTKSNLNAVGHADELLCEISKQASNYSESDVVFVNNATTTAAKLLPYSTIDDKEQNGNDINKTDNDIMEPEERRNGDDVCVEKFHGGISIHKTGSINLDLMQSVDLGDPTFNTLASSPTTNHTVESSYTENLQNMWHGSITTSTDTLVPIENRQQITNNPVPSDEHDIVDGREDTNYSCNNDQNSIHTKENRSNSTSTNCSILPKVHSTNNCRPNILSNSTYNNSFETSTSMSSMSNNVNGNSNHNHQNYPMEESILILPEHQKLEISISGKCETIPSGNESDSAATNDSAYDGGVPGAAVNMLTSMTSSSTTTSSNIYTPYLGATASFQRRRRTSSNTRRDASSIITANKPTNGSANSRYSVPGIRSLPMTPPGLTERAQIAISCPDGLAHALSEQNIRLQQIVHEHKQREDVLLRELYDMRMALLKKTCPNCCNAPTATNDEQCSAGDNLENASICSWEAVEDRSGPSSSTTSSSIQPPNATSVLWVPDHAVTRCTSCQTEFWLGRRKHHCRSCGQIFCADCSEFWAPVPDEKLFNPVRLCGPCYHAVTTRMQQQSRSYIATNHINSNNSDCNSMTKNALFTTSASALQHRQINASNVTTINNIVPLPPPAPMKNSLPSTSNSSSNTISTNSTPNHHARIEGVVHKTAQTLEACNHAAAAATKQQHSQHSANAMNVATAAATN